MAVVPCSRASAVLAESDTSCHARDGPDVRSPAGAASRTTCALLPPKPNALTPATAGSTVQGHGSRVRGTRNGLRSIPINGFGVLK